MKPSWAKRTTTCADCGQAITPGSPRISSIETTRGRIARRLNYHKDCAIRLIEDWFVNNPEPETLPATRRSKLLYLSLEQRHTRHHLLSQISHLRHQYLGIPGLGMKDPKTFTEEDWHRWHHFVTRYNSLVSQLQECGGLPKGSEYVPIIRKEASV